MCCLLRRKCVCGGMEVRGQISSRSTGCDSLRGSRILELVQLFGEDECFVPPGNPTRRPSVSPAATKLLPYRPHALLAHCCYCCNAAAIIATVSTDSTYIARRILTDSTDIARRILTDSTDIARRILIDSTDIARRILTDIPVLASAACKSGWKAICSYVRRRPMRCATYLFNFKPLFVSLSIIPYYTIPYQTVTYKE